MEDSNKNWVLASPMLLKSLALDRVYHFRAKLFQNLCDTLRHMETARHSAALCDTLQSSVTIWQPGVTLFMEAQDAIENRYGTTDGYSRRFNTKEKSTLYQVKQQYDQ
eukprot:gene20794-22832_t